MRKKKYLLTSLLFLALSIATGYYGLQLFGFFNKSQVLVKALSCSECASYEVVAGQSKIASQVQDPSDSVNISQAYITGESNPFASDYTKTFDYYVVTGRVTGLQKSASENVLFPVITASKWKHFNPDSGLPFAFFTLFFFFTAIRYFLKFRKANRPDATKSALLTHSNQPVKSP